MRADVPHWKPKALALVLLLAWLRAFPSYDALHTPFVDLTWQHVQIKIDHPLTDMGKLFPPESHDSKLTFRLTVPLLAHVFGLGRRGLLILSGLAGILLLYSLLSVSFTVTGSRTIAVSVCLIAACSWAGETAFHELRGGYYDAVAICLLMLAMTTNRAPVIGLFLFLAAWTDERALLASVFVFLFWSMGGRVLNPRTLAVVGACAAYLATRAALAFTCSFVSVTRAGVGFSLLAQQVHLMPLAMWSGLAGNSILIAFILVALIRAKRYEAAAVYGAAVALMVLAALSVIDVTRSMAYLIVGQAYLPAQANQKYPLHNLAIALAALSFIIPSFYMEGTAGFWWLHSLPWQIFHQLP